MKWYWVIGLFAILFSIVAVVIIIANNDKNNPSSENITKDNLPQGVSHKDCKYWYGQWLLSKSQRDSYEPTSAKYLQFELDMKEKRIKLDESCYGK